MSFSEKSSSQEDSNRQSPVETEINAIQVNTQICCLSQNVEQPISLTASSISESEMIASTSAEKISESLKEIDFEKKLDNSSEKVQDSTSITLQSISLGDSSALKSEVISSIKMEKLAESLKEIDIEKNVGELSEKVQETKSEPITLQPSSLAGCSISPSKTITSIKGKNLKDSLKKIDIEKNPGAISEEVKDCESASVNLGMYLDSINIGAIISTNHFLTKRFPYLKKLIDEAINLHTFMESLNNLRHEFQPCSHTSLSCLTLIPEEWHKFTKDWEIFINQIHDLVETTNEIMQHCDDNSLIIREEFATYLDNLLVVSEAIGEMEEICDQALTKYRQFCFNYDNYLFLLHVSTMNPHLMSLHQRVMQECGKFSTFEAEIGEQIKQAQEKADGLF